MMHPARHLVLMLLVGTAWAETLPHRDAALINAEVPVVFDALAAGQAAYKTANPTARYIQLTPPTSESDGLTPRTPDPLSIRPSDRTAGLPELGVTLGSVRCDYVIDEYVASPGPGFLLHAQIRDVSGWRWRRTRHVGPGGFVDTDRDDGWTALPPQIEATTTTTTTRAPLPTTTIRVIP